MHDAELAAKRISEGIALPQDQRRSAPGVPACERGDGHRGPPTLTRAVHRRLRALLSPLSACVPAPQRRLDGRPHPRRSQNGLGADFFPTGGGKTEAYLGLIAFALLLRRMRGANEPHGGLGVAVILRYTLRLLTLDQLERATALICALEVLPDARAHASWERALHRGPLGWPQRHRQHHGGDQRPAQSTTRISVATPRLSARELPLCGRKPGKASFDLRPNATKKPERLIVRCLNAGDCEFANPNPDGLPLLFVDEQVYRELPSFLIATVDKFAMMPWRGEAGMLFGKVQAVGEGGSSDRSTIPLRRRPRLQRVSCRPSSSFRTSCISSPALLAPWSVSTRFRSRRSARRKSTGTRCPQDYRLHRHRQSRSRPDSRALRPP